MDRVLKKPQQNHIAARQSDSLEDLPPYFQGLSLRTPSPALLESSDVRNLPPDDLPQPPLQQRATLPTPSCAGSTRTDTPHTSSGVLETEVRPPNPAPNSRTPEPSEGYIRTSSLPPHRLTSPTMKLLILDLNGTLLYRPRNPKKDRDLDMLQASMAPILRPYLEEFMSYVFKHFKVMFWSSATPRNVKSMIAATTTTEQRGKIVATWARDTLGLSPEDYNKKSITFKDLQKVFADEGIRNANDGCGDWDIGCTILLDDSVIKASFQPYNHVCVPEFVNGGRDDALWQVAGYLEELRYQGHVARFIKQNPFKLETGWNGRCIDS